MSYEIIRECELWPDEAVLNDYAERVLNVLGDFLEENEHINFAFSDDAAIQLLNRDFRDKDKPTNVLSFPDGDVGSAGEVFLGDIMLAYETIEQEAVLESKVFEHHVVHLMLHGALHLLGYDHITDEDAAEMEALEVELLAEMGISNPYEQADA